MTKPPAIVVSLMAIASSVVFNDFSTYGDIGVDTRVSSYTDFIDMWVPIAAVPEPSSLVLLIVGLLLAPLFRIGQICRAAPPRC